MRGINSPLVVDLISRSDEAFGVVVPIPALPVDGKVFVCAIEWLVMVIRMIPIKMLSNFFIKYFFSAKVSSSLSRIQSHICTIEAVIEALASYKCVRELPPFPLRSFHCNFLSAYSSTPMRFGFLLLIIFCERIFGFAQTQSISQHFDHYNFEKGLSSNRVQCIAQDSDGFLWIGTASGLNR